MTALQFLRRHSIDTRPLRILPYRRLFIGTAVSNFGFQFTAVAVPQQMYAITGSTLYVGLIGTAALGPLVVFGLWGGAIADTVDRRKLLLVASLTMWTSTLGLLTQALLGLHRPGVLLALVALQASALAVSSPTRNAIIPRLVPAPEIPAANTLSSTVFNAALTAGPLCAGLVVRDGSDRYAPWAYGIDAIAFTVALWATLRLPSLPPGAPRAAAAPVEPEPALERMSVGAERGDAGEGTGDAAGGPVAVVLEPVVVEAPAPARRVAGWAEIRAGLTFIAQSPVLLLSFVIDIAAMVLALPRAIFPQVAAERYGPASVGWLYAAIGLGSVVAGLTSGWIGRVRRQGMALVVAVVVWGLSVAAAGLAGRLWLTVFFMALGGAADMVSAVYRQSIVQTYAPDGLQGRLQGVFIAVVTGGPRLGDLRAGLTATLVGPTIAWVGGGLAAAVVAAVLALSFPVLLRYTAGSVRS